MIEENNITKLISNITNDDQSIIILNLYSYYSTMYLIEIYKKENSITVEIFGNLNKDKRNKYTITISNILECDCKDYIYRCKSNGILCKHICFIICKVCKIYDVGIFCNILSNKNYNMLNYILNKSILDDKNISFTAINKEFNKNYDKEINNLDCLICYDNLNIKEIISCPDCNQFIHKECMHIWLEKNSKCVYCRSNSWLKYIVNI